MNLTVNQFFWAAAQICCIRMFHVNHGSRETIRHGGEARSYSSHMQEISFVAHSSYLCIIKQGGASPEYMSDTAPLLATVNMLDKNRRGFLKTRRVHNEKDPGIEGALNSPLKGI